MKLKMLFVFLNTVEKKSNLNIDLLVTLQIKFDNNINENIKKADFTD